MQFLPLLHLSHHIANSSFTLQVSLRVDEKEVEYVLQDKALLAACLNDSAML